MSRGYNRELTNIHKLHYHFIWCPKYRKPVLKNEVAEDLGQLIREKADELGLGILNLSIQPDHVHLFIEGDPKLRPNKIIQQIKGYTSRNIREKHGSLNLPSLWTRSYFVSSAGEVSSQTIEEYIENQTGQ